MTAIDLKGKAIIVSGAGSGLGQAMTLGLAGAGASVLAIDIDPSRIEETVQKAEALSGQVVGHSTGAVRTAVIWDGRGNPTALPPLPGDTAFLLHDTYGFPLEVTQEIAAERLSLPFSTYRRHLTKGVERVVEWSRVVAWW